MYSFLVGLPAACLVPYVTSGDSQLHCTYVQRWLVTHVTRSGDGGGVSEEQLGSGDSMLLSVTPWPAGGSRGMQMPW